MLADSGIVHTDVVVAQSEAGDEASCRQLHLCRHAHKVRAVDARLTTLVGAVTITDFTQSLSTQRHGVG